jgi:hypothetical protein
MSKLTYEAYRHIPAAYLFCTEDRILHVDNQRAMVAAAGITLTKEVKSGHVPFVSMPKSVVEFVQEVVDAKLDG